MATFPAPEKISGYARLLSMQKILRGADCYNVRLWPKAEVSDPLNTPDISSALCLITELRSSGQPISASDPFLLAERVIATNSATMA